MKTARPFRLAPYFSPRIWGQTDWTRWYDNATFAEPVGEAWLTGESCVVETGEWAGQRFADVVKKNAEQILGVASGPAEFPLLLKLLAPREKLSLQVHPDDASAQSKGYPRGKTECWYVLDAIPGAAIALGLKDGVDDAAVRQAVAGHTMEEMMSWLPVGQGEMIFVDAGTVHAIGPGVTLLETQQTSDTTYRLYDYGRPRELHLDDALRVMKPHTRAGKVSPIQHEGFVRLIQEQYFTVDRFLLKSEESPAFAASPVPQIFVALAGQASLLCDGERIALERGKAVIVPAGADASTVQSQTQAEFIRAIPGSQKQ
ncbi:MAG TPA: type I phosphomannose isomerase catalytic subunit [Acidobacteriaceae bacterium]|nr:type I phosphomannose isomerase catalytic subunit [Acidobacteriaceae bacterium]